jgi:hypothetical protein
LRIGAALVASIVALSCGPVPGGRLSGEVEALPSDWTSLTEGLDGICEVESRPADPHSIQLQCYTHEGSLYVHSHRWALASWYPFESWAEIWLEHPEVRARLGRSIYELRAEAIQERGLREAVLSSRGYDPVPEGIVLFHLRPR